MNLRNVKIVDTNFAHAKFTTDYQESKTINWDRTPNHDENEIVFITDNSMTFHPHIIGRKIGMLMEPRVINPNIYNWVLNNSESLDKILTYDKKLLCSVSNSIFYPHCGCWIKSEDQLIHNKTKLLSIIASNKNQTIGHKLRNHAINIAANNDIEIGVFGRGYNPIDYKLDGLKNFAFSIIIENSKEDYYFTEKLIDSFITGTVPIYWGCPSISKFFNTDGMIIFDDMDTLLNELKTLSLDRYHSMSKAIEENYQKAKEYLIAEDWIYKNTEIFK